MGVLKNTLIAVMFFSMIIAGAAFMIGETGTAYNISTDTEFNETYNLIEEMSNQSEAMQSTLTSEGGYEPGAQFLIFKGTWYVLRSILAVPALIFGIMSSLFQEFGIPWWAGWALTGIILTIIITAIISTALKKDL